MEELILSLVLQIIGHFVKNPTRAVTYKNQLLGIRNAINALFPGE